MGIIQDYIVRVLDKIESRFSLSIVLLVLFTSCSTAIHKRSAELNYPVQEVQSAQQGLASWYGRKFQNRRTASGARFNMRALTAAHRTLPFGSRVRVTNLRNGKSVIVVINDRGPASRKRIIDLSYKAARELSIVQYGVSAVRIEVL